MSSRTLSAGVGLALAVGLAACGGGGDGKSAKPPKLTGIVTDGFARSVPLDTPRARFEKLAKTKPVQVTQQHAKAADYDTAKLKAKDRRKLIREWGKPDKSGVVHIPPRDYQCLHYRGEKPTKYGWKFCFDKSNTLQFIVTTGALPTPS
jgi:hypothetical protein